MAEEQTGELTKPYKESNVGEWPEQDVTRAYFTAIGEVMRANGVQPPDVRETHQNRYGVQEVEHVIVYPTQESFRAYKRLSAQIVPFLGDYARQRGVDQRALEGRRMQDGIQILTFDGMDNDQFRMSLLYQRLKRQLAQQWETTSHQ